MFRVSQAREKHQVSNRNIIPQGNSIVNQGNRVEYQQKPPLNFQNRPEQPSQKLPYYQPSKAIEKEPQRQIARSSSR